MSRPSTKFIPANLKQQLGAVSNAYNSNENDVVGPHTVAGGLAGNTKKNRHTKKTSKNTRCGNGTSTQTTSNCTCAAVCSGGIASPAAYRNGY